MGLSRFPSEEVIPDNNDNAIPEYPETIHSVPMVEPYRYHVLSNGYPIEISPGQRKYGGPPMDWDGQVPTQDCEVS